MFKKILIYILPIFFTSFLFANDGNRELQEAAILQDEEARSSDNYVLSAQIGAYYTQGYGNYIHDGANVGERKVDFSNIFASVGFEGIEFDHLRFGANALGSIKLSGGKTESGDVYRDNMASDALLYQLFVGYTSDYFDISVGREALDLNWVNDFVQGGRFAIKIPDANTTISGFYFDRQAVADPNEIVTFDNKVGPTFIGAISNNSLEFFAVDVYFISAGLFNGAGFDAALSFGNEDSIISNTILKYTFLDSKNQEFNNTNYVQLEENLGFGFGESSLGVAVGAIKMFNAKNLDRLEIEVLGDQNPLEQGDLAYAKDALTIYAGLTYTYNDLFEILLVYGNTSGVKEWDADNLTNTKLKGINEINVGFGTTIAGFELSFIYSKILSNNLEAITDKKTNRDYFEAMVAYNF
ncbi:hypothetical protein CCY99_03925 [Helicobacter sp. 16-1353]|uniref:Opr family porin n=1 Tax=Helicobacter sp. 16-1353 TaxID=2004996 RepID=UPI000DCD856F|nr:Opr family porin [Helicobacter sp. 16-1353]RAX54505.1 hypothetical protein CCY99_03925 [Helicobacter sp. 16-1353]